MNSIEAEPKMWIFMILVLTNAGAKNLRDKCVNSPHTVILASLLRHASWGPLHLLTFAYRFIRIMRSEWCVPFSWRF